MPDAAARVAELLALGRARRRGAPAGAHLLARHGAAPGAGARAAARAGAAAARRALQRARSRGRRRARRRGCATLRARRARHRAQHARRRARRRRSRPASPSSHRGPDRVERSGGGAEPRSSRRRTTASPAGRALMLRGALAILRKDLRIEWRTQREPRRASWCSACCWSSSSPSRTIPTPERGARARAERAVGDVRLHRPARRPARLPPRARERLSRRPARRRRSTRPRSTLGKLRGQRGAAGGHAGASCVPLVGALPARRRRPVPAGARCSSCCSATSASRRWRRCSPP